MRKFLSVILLILVLALSVMPAFAQERPSIPEILTNDADGRFTTLLAAVEAAGLVETLSGEGPFTLLAPTNDAFAAALEALGMTPLDVLSNPELLTAILTYHVLPGQYFFRNLTGGPSIATVQGEEVDFDLTDGAFTVNGINIGDVDNIASNGIIQVIDGVLIPPSIAATLTAPAEQTAEPTAEPTTGEAAVRANLPEALAADADGRFTTLLAAVEAAGLVDALNGDGPFTVFAPTNDAFVAALDYLGLDASDLLGDTELLTRILSYHVAPGQFFFRDLIGGATISTLLGDSIGSSLTLGQNELAQFTVNGITISDVDNVAGNGVFYAIDGVLLPPALAEAAAANRAHIRVAHLSADAGAVDVYVNDALLLEGVTFGTVGAWLEVPAGAKNIAIVPTGETSDNSNLKRIEAGSWVTIAAAGLVANETLSIEYLVEDYSPLAENQARITVFHGLTGLPAVDVLADGGALIIGLAYPGTFGDNDGLDTRDVGNATYTLQIVLSGTTEPVLLQAELGAQIGINYFIAATGTLGNPSLVIIPTNVAEVTSAQ